LLLVRNIEKELTVTDKPDTTQTILTKLRATFPILGEDAPDEAPPKPPSSAELLLITPTVADSFLKNNKKNRRVRQLRVHQYAKAMRAGSWVHTGEAIMFDEDGNLINGQHRLLAIILANVSAWMYVVDDLPSDVRTVIDGNKPRTAADLLLYTRELPDGTQHAAILRAMHAYGTWQPVHTALVPLQDNRTFLTAWDKYADAVLFARGTKAQKTPLTSPLLSVIARAFYHGESPEMLQEFLRIVKTGMPTEDPKHNVLMPVMLRDWLMMGNPRQGRRTTRSLGYPYRVEIALRAERALYHYLKNTKATRILLQRADSNNSTKNRYWLIDPLDE
jgi:hypothetical protein